MIGTPSPAQAWNSIVLSFPGSHLLQSWEWGQIKSQFGWSLIYALWSHDSSFQLFNQSEFSKIDFANGQIASQNIQAAALILQRKIPFGRFAKQLNILYAPKGPLLDWSDHGLMYRVMGELQTLARQQHSIFIKVDPDLRVGTGIPGSANDVTNDDGNTFIDTLQANKWLISKEQIQFRNTVIIDLSDTEDVLLARMKQKTRYNIHLAERKGVTIRQGGQEDIPLLYQMYAETSFRDGFVIRHEGYYQTVIRTFLANASNDSTLLPTVKLLIAEVDQEPVAAIAIFLFGNKAWYIYGMSRQMHREKMPNYLLQWEGIKLAKRLGCTQYDLWGAPDQFVETDSLWGVYRFKEGLGGSVVRHVGAWDYPVNPHFYRLYTQSLPRLLDILRKRQKLNTQRFLE